MPRSTKRFCLLILTVVLIGWTSFWTGNAASVGYLDPTFDGDGKVTTDFFGDNDEAHALIVQPDGKLVAAGTAEKDGSGGFNFALARYNPDGSLDASFGTGGKVTTDFNGGRDIAYTLILQPDGKLVAAGSDDQPEADVFNFALARYNPDGSLDASFGTGGKITTDFFGDPDSARALIIQPDGKLVAAGTAFQSGAGGFNFALARYNPDGSLDTSFGTGGKITTDFGGEDRALALVVQPDGKLVAAGYETIGGRDFALARYNADGSLDTSFSADGKATTDFSGNSDSAQSLVILSNGKLVAAGDAIQSGAGILNFALARYNTNGSLDTSFGTGGKVTTDFSVSPDSARALIIQPDGKLVAAGNSNFGFALARYNANGTLDTSFGTAGKVTTDFYGESGSARALILQPDGKFVAAGSWFQNSSADGDFALARYGITSSAHFTTQPSTTVAGAVLTPAVQVAIQDPSGNIITTANDAVTIAIGNNPGGGTLSGTTTVEAVNGVATFSDLSINTPGNGYTLTATSGTLNTTSAAFNIAEPTENDADDDGIPDAADNCPLAYNPDQAQSDNDGQGNACDPDDDNDGSTDTEEIAAGTDPTNPASRPELCDGIDNDGDGSLDEGFTNTDGDALADCVDADDDNDGSTDDEEAGTGTDPTNADSDGDGVADGADNCPSSANAEQADADGDGLGNACDPINGTPGLSYETLHHISFDNPMITLAGFDFDPQNRPALGWREASANGGGINLRWARRENNAWVKNTMAPHSGGIRAAQPDFILRQDGTPFFAYTIRDAFIEGQEWYTAHIVDLGAQPTGHGPSLQPIEAGQSCIAAYPKFAMDFAPGAVSPSFLVGTHCAFSGWLALNNAAIHGAPRFRAPAGTGGEFHSIDYAAGPDGSHHVTYYAERGGTDGWGAYYSNGSPGHEIRLVKPHRNRAAETSVAVGPDGRIHVAIGGAQLCNNTFEGGLLYLTSTDGVNWTRTFVDTLGGRSPSLVLDAEGRPRIAYWRSTSEVRYASFDDGAWSTSPVYTASTPVGLTSVKLAFDANGQPHVLFFNPDTSDITIASGVHTNLPPVVANPGAQTSEAGDPAALQIEATDTEAGALTYSACNLPPGLSIDPVTGVVTGTVTPGTPSNDYAVTITVNDPAGNNSTVGFVWTVKVNKAPTLTGPGNRTNAEGDAITLSIAATDPDSDALTYAAAGLPPGLSIDPATGVIVGTLDYDSAGTYPVTITASDGALSAGASFNWTVANVNRAPAAADSATATDEDASVQIALAATDADGDALTYDIVGDSAHGAVTLSNGVATYTPAPNYNGADSFTFRASDGNADSNVATISITISPVNDAPAASDGAASLDEDTQVEITLAGADIDSAALGFALVGEPLNGTLSAVAGNRVVYTPNSNFSGGDSFTFIANDGAANSNIATVTITVLPVADPPVLATVGNQVVAEGAPLSFTLTASDPDGEQLTFSVTGLPAGASLDSTTGGFSWTPTYEQAGVYTLIFTVTDPTSLSASETITITVNDVVQNLGPVCSAAYPSIGEIWPPNHLRTELVSIFGVTDPDNDPVTINVRQVLQDEPTNTHGDGNTWIDGGGLGSGQAWVRAERSGTNRVAGNGRVYEIFFEASDGRGKSCTGSVKVGVPHDQGRRGGAVDDGKRYDSTVAGGPCLNCQ